MWPSDHVFKQDMKSEIKALALQMPVADYEMVHLGGN